MGNVNVALDDASVALEDARMCSYNSQPSKML